MNPSESSSSTPRPPKLLDRLREPAAPQHVSEATVQQYAHWALPYILFHQKRHPQELDETHVRAFLSHLAGTRPDAVPPARLALVFLYRGKLDGAEKGTHLLFGHDNRCVPFSSPVLRQEVRPEG